MKISFIGAGKVSSSMGIYIDSKGIKIGGYYSLTKNSAQKASQKTNSMAYDNINELINHANIIGITTPDDVIASVVDEIYHLNKHLAGKIIFHTSGVHSSDILTPLFEQGATVLSLHPMLSFNEPFNTVEELHTTYFTVEGKGNGIHKFQQMLDILGNPWIEISPQEKILYHTAATIMSNYLVTVIDIGTQMLTKIGLTNGSALKMTEPLIRKTINNIFEYGTEKALTGPIARGDIGTVKKHIANLNMKETAWLEIYKQLGIETVNLASRSGKIGMEKVNKLKGELEYDNEKSDDCDVSKNETK